MRSSVLIALLAAGCCYLPAPAPGSRSAPPAPVPTITPPSPGRTCVITVEASFPDTKPNGSPWDVAGGAPDPFVIVRQDGAELARTAQAQDQYDVTFTVETACDHSRPMTVELVDRDVAADDAGGTFYVDAGAGYALPVVAGGIVGMITIARR